MSIADAPEPISANQDQTAAHIADESFNFRTFPFDDRKVTGGQIAEAFGAHPVTEFVVLHQLANLELEELRPTEIADLKKADRFFVIRSDGTYRFFVDGLSMVWPLKTLKGRYIKQLVGKDNADTELLLEREEQPDKVISDDHDVRLAGDGVEKFKTRPAKATLTIIVEGSPHSWTKNKISYDQVVTLEVPDYAQHPEITYSVKYTNGPNNRPDGVLAKGESVHVKDGMIFSVSETGQS
ncbi:multiubiquitin domain-containing protein [Xanthobacter oligotrophicus]|uniref:multiubiquitin domain-containing protein n=1 Tax=Xanthobacter oligotrophicus TaxID=2607286 RepID=UPI0011F0C713|nr:multiubiquitin domain-containing protein [Xanthobacter oligotrophicus]MCG5234534.1 multiubiquitin domain-containing protein [Xanthobacter oligotrophicus]